MPTITNYDGGIVTTPQKPMALGWRLVDAPTVVTAPCPCANR